MATPDPATDTKADPATDTKSEESESDEEPTDEAILKKMEPVPVMSTTEVEHFESLGLGRGIDSSDPDFWQNKSPMQIRRVKKDLQNVIGVDESGIVHRYEKIVSSLKTQQSKIQTSLTDPASTVSIGLDAHYSQSSTSSRVVKGTRVQTRTISFRYDFDDLEVDSDLAEALLLKSAAKSTGYRTFENNLATWILAQLLDEQGHGKIPPTPDIRKLKGKTAAERLAVYAQSIKSLDSEAAKVLSLSCRTFMFEFGITHYVSSIELGALRYSVVTSKSQTTDFGVGGNIGASSVASGSASTNVQHTSLEKTKQEQEIGHFNKKGEVRRDTSDEAVIGFQLEPISKLIRVPKVQLAMVTAITLYLQSKTDDTYGPFLISATINKKPVYWNVNQEQSSLIGTEDIRIASLFYIIATGDRFAPGTFTFAYWGDKKKDRKLITDVNDRLSKLRSFSPKVPTFLTTETSIFNSMNGPLLFQSTFGIKNAVYTIHSRIYSSGVCLTQVAEPVSFQTWMQGDEFYIKNSPHALKSNFLALELQGKNPPSYTSNAYSSTKKQGQKGIGMLFRLHPYQLKLLNEETVDREVLNQSLLPGATNE